MRSDDDQWNITESVGATALGVASARAMETGRADGLVDDPYAGEFVAAARDEIELPTEQPEGDDLWGAQSTYIGVRSRFFDEFFGAAADAGVHQVVLLAAGLDTRAQRLTWPAGTTVFEVDQGGVLDFKDGVLGDDADGGAGVRRVAVRVDLRHDWPAALRAAGFDATAPTAWLAEGLLPYLPAQAEADLFADVQELSAPGSRIAVEHFGDHVREIAANPTFQAMSERFGVQIGELFFDEPRGADPSVRLGELGWDVRTHAAHDLADRYGRPLEGATAEVFSQVILFDAQRRA